MKSLPSNYDLKNAQEDYKLWDKVHAKEVMAHLVMLSRWEPPGKKEIERRKMLEAKKAKLEAKEETNEERLNKIEQMNTLAKGKTCWGKAKGIVRLSGLEMFSCMNATRFDKQGINKWHKYVQSIFHFHYLFLSKDIASLLRLMKVIILIVF